jgi:predicted RNase H-like HicB family nuclease
VREFTAVIVQDHASGWLVGYVPGWPGAHAQGETIEDVCASLGEVIRLMLQNGPPVLEARFVGIETLVV